MGLFGKKAQKRGQPGNAGQFAADTSGRTAPTPSHMPRRQEPTASQSQGGASTSEGQNGPYPYLAAHASISKKMREIAKAREASGKPFSASEEQRDEVVRAYLLRGTRASLGVQWAAIAQDKSRIERIRSELEAQGKLPPRNSTG